MIVGGKEVPNPWVFSSPSAASGRLYHHDGRPVREPPCREDARSDDEYLFALATTKAALVAWGEARGDSFKIVDYEIEPTHSDLNQYGENGEVLRVLEKDHFRGYCFGPRYIDQESPPVQPSTVGDSSGQTLLDTASSGTAECDELTATNPEAISNKQPPFSWQEQARAIADEIDKADSPNAYDSVTHIAERVASVMRDRKINGPRGPLAPTTILREALQGKRWKRKR